MPDRTGLHHLRLSQHLISRSRFHPLLWQNAVTAITHSPPGSDFHPLEINHLTKNRRPAPTPQATIFDMASELQSENARRNGAKSRGPLSDVGKSRSARNATTHGMLSKSIVIEGEVAARFAALLASLRDVLQPRNSIEDGLIEDLAVCRWRQRRLLCMEIAAFSSEIRRQDPQTGAESTALRAARALGNMSADSRALDLISRYERQYDRQYKRTLRCLFDLRRETSPE
jgi:hypothetical protein